LNIRLQVSLLHNLLLALVDYLGQDSKQSIVVKIQLQREQDLSNRSKRQRICYSFIKPY